MHIKTIQQWESTFRGKGQVDFKTKLSSSCHPFFSLCLPPPKKKISDAQTKLTFVKCFSRASDVMPFL